MRKFLIAVTMLAASTAFAGGNHHKGNSQSNNWVAPLIIGTIIGSVITSSANAQPNPVIIEREIYVQPQPQTPLPMYQYIDVYFPSCNCTRSVLVRIN
jgi:hypothetical protein